MPLSHSQDGDCQHIGPQHIRAKCPGRVSQADGNQPIVAGGSFGDFISADERNRSWKRGVTPDTALRLSRVVGMSAIGLAFSRTGTCGMQCGAIRQPRSAKLDPLGAKLSVVADRPNRDWTISQRRPDLPRHEFFVAVAVQLALGFFAAGDGRGSFRRFRGRRFRRCGRARISPALMSMSSIIRSYIGVLVATLIVGQGLRPIAASAAGGEDHHVAAAGDEAGDARRIEARRVHEDEALWRSIGSAY